MMNRMLFVTALMALPLAVQSMDLNEILAAKRPVLLAKITEGKIDAGHKSNLTYDVSVERALRGKSGSAHQHFDSALHLKVGSEYVLFLLPDKAGNDAVEGAMEVKTIHRFGKADVVGVVIDVDDRSVRQSPMFLLPGIKPDVETVHVTGNTATSSADFGFTKFQWYPLPALEHFVLQSGRQP